MANIDFTSKELIDQAMKILKNSREYRKLEEKLQKYQQHNQYLQVLETKKKMDELIQQAARKVAEKEVDEACSSKEILKRLGGADKDKYMNCLNTLCFCFDIMESVFIDLNDILKRMGEGFTSEQFPEIIACKKRVSETIHSEMNEMDAEQQDIYVNEVDSIYDHMKARSGILRRKLDKLAKKREKDAQKA